MTENQKAEVLQFMEEETIKKVMVLYEVYEEGNAKASIVAMSDSDWQNRKAETIEKVLRDYFDEQYSDCDDDYFCYDDEIKQAVEALTAGSAAGFNGDSLFWEGVEMIASDHVLDSIQWPEKVYVFTAEQAWDGEVADVIVKTFRTRAAAQEYMHKFIHENDEESIEDYVKRKDWYVEMDEPNLYRACEDGRYTTDHIEITITECNIE